jgi:hypothetical protein
MLPKFETNASASLQRVQSTFGLRGTEYGDTMKNCQWLTMKAVARKFGVDIPPDLFRALAVGGLCDLKYQRQEGGYKDDNFVDAIAYLAFLAQDMLDLETARQLATNHIKSNGTPLARKSP